MTTDNVAETTPERLRDEPAQTREQYNFIINLARDANVRLTRDLVQARNELAAVDEALGEFYCPVLDPETDEPCGSFYKDHGVNVMRQELENRTISLQILKTAFDNEFEMRTSAQVELEQARAGQAHAQTEAARLGTALADACAARDALARECNQLEADREYNASLVMGRDRELTRMRKAAQEQGDELAQVRADHEQSARIVREENTRLAQSLTQARSELKDLQGANRALAQQVDDVTENRESWYKEARDAENERDEWHRVARQERAWVRTKEAQIAGIRESVEWLWGYYDGNTLTAKAGYEDAIREAWGKLLVAVDSADSTPSEHPAVMPLKQQVTELEAGRDYWRKRCKHDTAVLDAAEAALADCGIGGIRDKFDGLADAIQQMSEHIKKLSKEHNQLVDRVEDAMGQIEKYDEHLAENLIQYAVEDILERLREAEQELKQAQAGLDAEPVEAEITGQEMVQALQAERRLRQEAEQHAEKAETERDDISENLKRMVELNEWSQNELDRIGGRAEALAQERDE